MDDDDEDSAKEKTFFFFTKKVIEINRKLALLDGGKKLTAEREKKG